MKAIITPQPGDAGVLTVTELPDPIPRAGQVLIHVVAAGVNRADLNQREGHYPPPAGASPLLGLEVSGTIVALGDGVVEWAIGDRVCALLPGGGYATLAVADAGQVLPVPENIDLVDAAGLPETVATTWSNLFLTAGMVAGETLLIHGGSSGIGTMAIQLATALGIRVAVTAGGGEKLEACRRLGADVLIDYRNEDFVERIIADTDGRGVDVVFDAIGGAYLERNIRCLAAHGRLVIIGDQSGEVGQLPVGQLMRKWASIHGTVLRARPAAEKDRIIASVRNHAWPLVGDGRLQPVIDSRFSFSDARLAHERMESSAHIGKILLTTDV